MKLLIGVRSLLASLLLLLSIVIFSLIVVFCAVVLRSIRWADFFIRLWGQLNVFIFNIRVRVKGEENLPPGGCLLLFNHSSHFDIIVLVATMKKMAHFGAKIELFSIPLFGHALRAVGTLPIVRGDRDRVLKLYDESIARVHAGESFYLAAEGTRQPTPGVGERFKQGPIVFAINGQFPIVPIVIKGAAECLPKGHLIACLQHWAHEIQIQILPAISTQGLTVEDRQSLTLQAQNLMTKAYQQL